MSNNQLSKFIVLLKIKYLKHIFLLEINIVLILLRNMNILKLKNISFMLRNVKISGYIPMDWYTQPFMPLYN